MERVDANTSAITRAATDACSNRSDGVALILLAEDSDVSLDQIRHALLETDIEFVAAVFPGLIHGTSRLDTGALVARLPVVSAPVLVQDLSDGGSEPLRETAGAASALVLVDGLSAGIGRFLVDTWRALDAPLPMFGGGAGSLSLRQAPCLATREGVFQDAAVILLLNARAGVGVQHGWERLHGPLIATKTSRNVIEQINWRPAFEVYRDVLREDAGIEVDADHFFDVSKGFPFGLVRSESEPVIRDPIAVDDRGGLICVGEVPENAPIDIFSGRPESLMSAAADATQTSLASLEGTPDQVFVVDCVSRSIFLDSRFEEELDAIQRRGTDGQAQAFGALTLGEIASVGLGYLEFFNKTCVVAALGERSGQ